MRGGFIWAKSAGVSCRPIKLRRNLPRAFETVRSVLPILTLFIAVGISVSLFSCSILKSEPTSSDTPRRLRRSASRADWLTFCSEPCNCSSGAAAKIVALQFRRRLSVGRFGIGIRLLRSRGGCSDQSCGNADPASRAKSRRQRWNRPSRHCSEPRPCTHS